jgi:murein DD-endopeptidase MepM/ murein hydrolase activator NlpD
MIEVIRVKKNKFTEFFKGKGYYVLLFVGVIAIAAVALIGSQLSSKQNSNEEQKIVDLNDTDNNIAAGDSGNKVAESNPVTDSVANNAGNTSSGTTAANDKAGQKTASNDAELEDFSEKPANQAKLAQAGVTEPATVETTGKKLEADNSAAIAGLSFKADDELSWPVQGNVIMNYSMDRTTYFATLMQYKCNPAIIIDAEVGAEVKAATEGIVTAIDEDNEETGFTLTMNIGDGYSLI